MEQRFEVALLLSEGMIYNDILDRTGASSATISRVRRSMLDNGAGGVMREVIPIHSFVPYWYPGKFTCVKCSTGKWGSKEPAGFFPEKLFPLLTFPKKFAMIL